MKRHTPNGRIFSMVKSISPHILLIIRFTLLFQLLSVPGLIGIGQPANSTDTVLNKIVTGAVNTVSGDILSKSPSVNLSNNLAGRLPGLTVINSGGEPGNDNAQFFVRGINTIGNNRPLIIVDGIPFRNLERLNPNDIESISVLKDASAAIYGMQAANGVILVTTRRGQPGKPIISINLNTGFNQPAKLPEMADAETYATMLNEISYYSNPAGGRNQRYTAIEIQKYRDGSDPWLYPNTDWFKEVIKPLSFQTSNHISVSGNSGKIGYFFSTGALYEDGNYKKSATNYSQYDFRMNIDANLSENIQLTLDMSGQQENSHYSSIDASAIFRYLSRSKPTMPAYWPNGLPGPDLEYGNNPAVISTDAPGYSKYTSYHLQTKAGLAIKIPGIKGLSINTFISLDLINAYHKILTRPWYLYNWDGVSYDANNIPVLIKVQRGATTTINAADEQKEHRNTYNAFLAYEISLSGNSRFNLITGFEIQQSRDWYSSDSFSSYEGHQRMGYYGKIGYTCSDKYLAEFAWRYDGSDIFSKGHQFGLFPALSVGWRISNERFWKENIHFLDILDFRASYGRTGSDRNLTGLVLNQSLPNPDITWETATQFNSGFNTGFLNNHVTLSADYFYYIRSGIPMLLPDSYGGFSLPYENIGKVKNQGFEYTLGYNGKSGEFIFEFTASGSYSKNKILFIDETTGLPDYQKATGRSIGSGLYYESIGIFKDAESLSVYPHWNGAIPGDIIFRDVNNDNVIDGRDRVRNTKSEVPMFIAGLSTSVKFRQLDLSLFFNGAAGGIVYISPESGDIGNFYKEYADNRWTPEQPDNTSPRTWNRFNTYWMNQLNTFWLQSTNYIRLKNLEVGYTFNARNREKSGTGNMRIYVSGFNLLTFSKFKLFDPEMSEGAAYPPQRIFNLGLKLTL
jgi:TonB-linked SusC/RagA family outer membrane protein